MNYVLFSKDVGAWNSDEESENKATEEPVSSQRFILVPATPRMFEKFLFSS